ncbi:hypothetical protein GCM10027053_43180 [Intrasporangium mesophilum]
MTYRGYASWAEYEAALDAREAALTARLDAYAAERARAESEKRAGSDDAARPSAEDD